MVENPRRGRQARNFTTNVPKKLVPKSSSEQIFSRKLPLGAPVLCLFVICACYASIIVKICCGTRPQHHGAARRQRKLTVTLLIMTIVSLLLWLPYAIATLVYYTTDSIRSLSYTKRMRLNTYLLLLFYTNSFVNPVVYTIRMPDYRKALLLLFTRRQRQNAVIPLQAR